MRSGLWLSVLLGCCALSSEAALSSTAAAGAQVESPVVRYFAQIAVGRIGELKFDTDFVFINSGAATEFVLEFFDPAGEPLSVGLFIEGADPEFSSVLRRPLASGEALSVLVRLDGAVRTGYARATTAESVSGVVAFTRTDVAAAKIQYQTGGPWSLFAGDFTIAVKFLTGVGDMAFAIANPVAESAAPAGARDAHLVFRLYDGAFQLRGEAEAVLPPGAQQARFIGELFPQLSDLAGGAGFSGSMTVESDRPLAVISVLHTNVPTLTVVPVTEGRAELAQTESAPASVREPEMQR